MSGFARLGFDRRRIKRIHPLLVLHITSSNSISFLLFFLYHCFVRSFYACSTRTIAEDLLVIFEKYGIVLDVIVPRADDCQGYALVLFKYEGEAQKAAEMLDGSMLDGNNIMVLFAEFGPYAAPMFLDEYELGRSRGEKGDYRNQSPSHAPCLIRCNDLDGERYGDEGRNLWLPSGSSRAKKLKVSTRKDGVLDINDPACMEALRYLIRAGRKMPVNEEIANACRKQNLFCAKQALEYYNATIKGADFKLVEALYSAAFVKRKVWYHTNFTAKPQNMDYHDSSTKLFFAELCQMWKGEAKVTACRVVDPNGFDARRGCGCCRRVMYHPTDGKFCIGTHSPSRRRSESPDHHKDCGSGRDDDEGQRQSFSKGSSRAEKAKGSVKKGGNLNRNDPAGMEISQDAIQSGRTALTGLGLPKDCKKAANSRAEKAKGSVKKGGNLNRNNPARMEISQDAIQSGRTALTGLGLPKEFRVPDMFCAEQALQCYNATIEGAQFELVEALFAQDFETNGRHWYHTNFTAKPQNVDYSQASTELFFAEVLDNGDGEAKVTACCVIQPNGAELE